MIVLSVKDILGRQSRGYQSEIEVPKFQAYNFEIKKIMLKMLKLNDQYYRNSTEDPNRHVSQFLDVCD